MRFFPKNPSPALTANARSANGAESTQILNLWPRPVTELINSVSLREFMSYLNGKPKIEIVTEDVNNPTTNTAVRKNFVGKFLE